MRGLAARFRLVGSRLAALGLVGLAACSPYEPALPGTPFLCGDQEPRCPDGYHCVTDDDNRMVCRAEPAPDAGVDALRGAIAGP